MKSQKNKFLLQGKTTYLNCAYMAPLLKKVEKAGIKGIKAKRKPYQITPEHFFRDAETLRRLFAELIRAENPEDCVIIPSVSYGMANVLRNIDFPSGSNIITAGEQFPSNIYPWMGLKEKGVKLRMVQPPQTTAKRGETWNRQILEAIDENTRLVTLGHVHWADGTLFNLRAIRERTNQVGAFLAIDGTQSVGALPFSVKEIQPDALVCAGYKWLMGPYSIGMAYYGKRLQNGIPVEENWINREKSENFEDLINYKERYQPGALRYEVGEHSNFILVPMMVAALKQVLAWDPAKIQAYCKDLLDPYLDEIKETGGQVEEESYRGHHLVGIRYQDLDPEQAKKIFKNNRVSISIRGNSIRIAPHVYNENKDMKRLVKSLRELRK